jgi:DNA end-binding protein Ku
LPTAKRVAIGQLILHGRGHLVAIKALGKGLLLEILRYASEVRDAAPYFEQIDGDDVDGEAVKLAAQLIKAQSGPFEPDALPDEYARAVHELIRAKIEQRAPEVVLEEPRAPTPKVINIMDALKESMQKQGQTKMRESVRRRTGTSGAPKERAGRGTRTRPSSRTAH